MSMYCDVLLSTRSNKLLNVCVGSYYEKRDLEAWRMVLEGRGYTVQSQKQERPLVSDDG